MSCCQKPTETSAASSCCSTAAPGACATEGKKCCPIEKAQCLGKCLGPLVLRFGVAAFMLPHGYDKITHWSDTVAAFDKYMGIPAPLTAMAILTEFFAPLLLILGLGTRFAALALAILISVAAAKGGHIDNGWMVNWMGKTGADGKVLGHGIEAHVLFLAASLGILLIGPGKIALDGVVCRILGKKKGCCAK